MTAETVKLTNAKGESVEVAKALVDELFEHEKKVDDMLKTFMAANNNAGEDDDDDDDDDDDEPDSAAQEAPADAQNALSCSKAGLDALKAYAEWPAEKRHKEAVPKPLQNTLKSYVTPEEMEFVERVAKEGILVEVLNTAIEVQFTALTEICAAYASVRIDEIAKAAPNIMEGAERIRQYLGLKNEWTPEEMKHLENEMKVIKELDPNAY